MQHIADKLSHPTRGGPGDRGADVLGVQNGALWIVQCKHTTSSPPPRDAVREVVDAGKYYGASRLAIATSVDLARFSRARLLRAQHLASRSDRLVLLLLAEGSRR